MLRGLLALVLVASACLPEVPVVSETRSAGWTPGGVPPASDQDSWSELVTLRGSSGDIEVFAGVSDGYVAPIHAALLPDGRVLLVGYVRPEADTPDGFATYGRPPFAGIWTPPAAGQEPPREATLTNLHVPYDRRQWTSETINGQQWWVSDTLFCAGHTLTSDGQVFFAGGTRTENLTPDPVSPGPFWTVKGLAYSLAFDPGRDAWERVPGDMLGRPPLWPEALRWYPTVIRLADDRMLIVNGIGIAMAAPTTPTDQANLTIETWDRDAGYAVVSGHPADPGLPEGFPRTPWETWGGPYPHVFQLPEALPGEYDVLFLGDAGIPTLLSLAGPEPWLVRRDATRPAMDTNSGSAASAMLPIRLDGAGGYGRGTVLVAGGQCEYPDPAQRGHESATQRRLDVYDPLANAWRPPVDMGVGRHHAALVVLPDGRLSLYGGFDDCVDDPPEALGRAQTIDPLRDFATTLGTARVDELRDGRVVPEVHGYHTIALLLPDGRVLVGGGRHGGIMERATLRLHSPWYVAEPRPAIVEAPRSLAYERDFTLRWQGGALGDVVIVGLGSMTHSFDANQRHVQLRAVQTADGVATVTAPQDRRVAPAGHYMLFVLDDRRVPSVARIVHLGGGGEPEPTDGVPPEGGETSPPADPAPELPESEPEAEDDRAPEREASCDRDGLCDPGESGAWCGTDCCDWTTACDATRGDGGLEYCRRLTDRDGVQTDYRWLTADEAALWCDEPSDVCGSIWECGEGAWGTCGPDGWIEGDCG